MVISKKVIKVLLLSLLFLVFINPTVSKSYGNEAINSFHSDIVVNSDASMQVTETINVTCNGENIKHGIYRDFPTKYTDSKGSNYNVGFDVINVQRDGKNEKYEVSNMFNGKRITIGDKDITLSPGDYIYTIVYTTYRQIGYFKDHDELFWNVTGNGWQFPINEASADITLPQFLIMDTSILSGYTGVKGSKNADLVCSINEEGKAVYKTTKALSEGEGLSVFVTFPKGIVVQPSSAVFLSYWIKDNLSALIMLAGIILSLVIYLFAWNKYGRDPKKGTIIPLYTPPQGLSPENIRYIYNMKYDNKVLTSAVINMAVKGSVRIQEDKKSFKTIYTIIKIEEPETLTDIEKIIYNKLPQEIELKQESNSIMTEVTNKVRENLTNLYNDVYFKLNAGIVIFNVVLSIITAIISFGLFSDSVSSSVGILFIILIAENIIFAILMKAPTVEGRKLMDEIEGFKMFLSVTEKENLNLLNPPEKTPELFEKYLPYALALDIGQKWAEQFSAVFSKMAEEGQSYCPMWYYGANWDMYYAGRFTNSFDKSFSNAISSSSTPPGSSSGGSGGSGFGGGGGGGGGW
ncbi:MAG: DUF2207 domain-containing protein [Bacillota bacterium]|nr:DUF2207 domain-containing protein [Bacillota bacterium]